MSKSTSLKVALVYDRINKWGGAERLLLALKKIFPEAELYTLVHHQPTSSWASGFKIVPSFFNNLDWLQQRHELLAPLSPLGFEAFNFDGFDLVISITSADAKSVITKPGTLHICYCLTPTRYLWTGREEYLKEPDLGVFSRVAKAVLHKNIKWLQKRDFILAQRPDAYLAISDEVRKRVSDFYQRQSEVIYPPIDYSFWSGKRSKFSDLRSKNYLVVSRLVAHKKVDLVVKSFAQTTLQGYTLQVVGTGKQERALRKMATANVRFLGHVEDERLRRLYHQARAVVFPQKEDFGLVPLEAQAAGTPVIAFGEGGAVETIRDGQTGLFFKQQTVESLTEAIKKFEKMRFDREVCRRNAARYDEAIFLKKFSDKVESLYETNRNGGGTG